MKSIHCDACMKQIQNEALEVHLLPGVAVQTESGTTVAQRRGVQQLLLCGGCGAWLRSAFEHLKTSMGRP